MKCMVLPQYVGVVATGDPHVASFSWATHVSAELALSDKIA